MKNFRLTKTYIYVSILLSALVILPYILLLFDIKLLGKVDVLTIKGFLLYLSLILTINFALIKIFPKTFGKWQKLDEDLVEVWSIKQVLHTSLPLIILICSLLIILGWVYWEKT